MYYMLKENIANAFLAETTKNPPVGKQDLFMAHCREREHTPWGTVEGGRNDRIGACVRWFGWRFEEVGLCSELDTVRKWR